MITYENILIESMQSESAKQRAKPAGGARARGVTCCYCKLQRDSGCFRLALAFGVTTSEIPAADRGNWLKISSHRHE